jgi:hypothetical protein
MMVAARDAFMTSGAEGLRNVVPSVLHASYPTEKPRNGGLHAAFNVIADNAESGLDAVQKALWDLVNSRYVEEVDEGTYLCAVFVDGLSAHLEPYPGRYHPEYMRHGETPILPWKDNTRIYFNNYRQCWSKPRRVR